MAKVFDFNGNQNYPPVIEDPRTGVDGFWFYGIEHNKQTLSPQFNKMIRQSSPGSNWRNFGVSYHAPDSRLRTYLALSKPTTHCQYYLNGNTNNYYNRHDDNPWWTLDESKERGSGIYSHSSGGQTAVSFNGMNSDYIYHETWGAMTASQSLNDGGNQSSSVSDSYTFTWNPVGIQNNRVVGFCRSNSSNYDYPSSKWFSQRSAWPGDYDDRSFSTSSIGDYYNLQYIGQASDGNWLFQVNRNYYPLYNVIYKANWTGNTPTITTMFNDTSGYSSPGGTNQGGNFLNKSYVVYSCSKYMTDPRDSNKKLWYKPYFDSYGDYHPTIFTWDTTSDSFAVEKDISITGNKSSAVSDWTGLTSNTDSHNAEWLHNEYFISGGNKYITVMYLDYRTRHDGLGLKTWHTYQIDNSNPKALTYHSSITHSVVPKHFVWLNDSRTLMGVFFQGKFEMWSWSNATGWGKSTTITDHVYAMGRDSLDRMWYVTRSTKWGSSYLDTHLLTPSLPVTVTVSPAQTSYTYAGSTISTNLNVSAFNASGARIATSVKLVIEGASMKFSDNSTVKTVTTTTGGELSVAVNITGAGFTNVTASVEI